MNQIKLSDVPKEIGPMTPDENSLLNLQRAFGYTQEDLKFFLEPMIKTGEDPIGSMGRDIPLAALSSKVDYFMIFFFKIFAQVTNPYRPNKKNWLCH